MYNRSTGVQISVPRAHSSGVQQMIYHPSGKQAASGGNDNKIITYNLMTTPITYKTLGTHTSRIHTLAWSSDGRFLVSGGADKKVIVWNTVTGTKVAELIGHTGLVYNVAISHSGKYVVSSSNSPNNIRLWDVTSRRTIWSKNPQIAPPQLKGIAFRWDSQIFAFAEGKDVRFIDVAQRKEVGSIKTANDGNIQSVRWSPTGREILTTGWNSHTKIWRCP